MTFLLPLLLLLLLPFLLLLQRLALRLPLLPVPSVHPCCYLCCLSSVNLRQPPPSHVACNINCRAAS